MPTCKSTSRQEKNSKKTAGRFVQQWLPPSLRKQKKLRNCRKTENGTSSVFELKKTKKAKKTKEAKKTIKTINIMNTMNRKKTINTKKTMNTKKTKKTKKPKKTKKANSVLYCGMKKIKLLLFGRQNGFAKNLARVSGFLPFERGRQLGSAAFLASG